MKPKKRITALLLLLITLVSPILNANILAANDDIKVYINDNEIFFDVSPQIIDDRTMVPMRGIFEALGYNVSWDGSVQKITAEQGDNVLTLIIGQSSLFKNSDIIPLEVPPMIIEDRTLVPLRAIAEATGYDVDWIAETQSVISELPIV